MQLEIVFRGEAPCELTGNVHEQVQCGAGHRRSVSAGCLRKVDFVPLSDDSSGFATLSCLHLRLSGS